MRNQTFAIATLLTVIAQNVSAQTLELCPQLTSVFAAPQAICADVIALGGGKSRVCHVGFEYRSKAAVDLFDALVSDADICFGPDTRLPKDTAVNHPDSYWLIQYATPEGLLSLSLKDKVSLNRSFVFLRIEYRS